MTTPPVAGQRTMRARAAALFGWRGAILGTLVVPVGAAIAVGSLSANLIEPRWTAGGLPYAIGYPKNVEITATLLGVALGAATAACARWPAAWLAALALASAGFVQAARHCAAVPAALWLVILAPALLLAVGLELVHAPPAGPAPTDQPQRAAAVSLIWLAGTVFVLAAGPLTIQVFHHGEVLASAVDLLAGGRPFVTFPWPHGLHDTGAAALWSALTGKVGTSPVALAYATTNALAVPALYLFTRRASGSAAAAATGCWLAVAVMIVLLGERAFTVRSALAMLGTLVWFALALHLVLADTLARTALAGAALAIGHAFRIDASMFAAPATLAVLVHRRVIAPSGQRWQARVLDCLRAAAVLVIGSAATATAAHFVLGWPERHWFDFVFRQLPRYHSIANGLPFPWPCRADAAAWALYARIQAVATLVLGTLLLAAAVRRLTLGPGRRAATAPSADQVSLLLFLAVFAFASLRTGLGRSDEYHFYWLAPLLIGSALLVASPWLGRLAAPPRRNAAVIAALAAVIVLAAAPVAVGRLHQLAEHLRPNAPIGACADTMFTAAEAAMPHNATFIGATCEVEQVLRAHGIRRILIDHAAPWYYVRFDIPLPTPDYALNRAYTVAAQQQLIADVRAAGVQALFKVSGFNALVEYDVPNMYRVPIVEAYLRARRRGAPTIATPLGRLYAWNDAGPPAEAAAAHDPDDENLAVQVERVVADPATGFVEVGGWAADLTTHQPLARLSAVAPSPRGAEVTYGLPAPALAAAGWSLIARTPSADPLRLQLLLEAADGRRRLAPLDLPPARQLPALSGREWSGLRAAVDAAEQLGEADRAAAQPQ